MLKQITSILLSASVFLGSSNAAFADAVIRKPAARSKNAAEFYTGITTYFNPDTLKWIKISSRSPLYTYKGKKNTQYYRPLCYLTSSWLSNNKQNLTVHLTQSRSKSVSSVVQSTLGVSAPNVSLATSMSNSYSSTVSSSYTTDYTFVMKNYSTAYYYRPAFFGYLLKYGIIKTNRLTKRSSVMYSYTFDNGKGLYLKLARR